MFSFPQLKKNNKKNPALTWNGSLFSWGKKKVRKSYVL